jgi:hypothetical protein
MAGGHRGTHAICVVTISGNQRTNDPIALFARPITCTSGAGDNPHLRPANQGIGFDMWNASARGPRGALIHSAGTEIEP